jgi:SAM-dependent methyltransferase
MHRAAIYNRRNRERKAKTIVSILQDYFSNDLKSLTLLDVGSSTELITNYLAMYFGKATHQKDNLEFFHADSLKSGLPEDYFDAVICAQVYEHVPNAAILMDEIYRVLKSGGVCYFAAGNRLNIIEPHDHLPFLSLLPHPLAHAYVHWTNRGQVLLRKASHLLGTKEPGKQI